MKTKKLSFEVVKDQSAEPHKRYILRVKRGDVTIFAPRYAFLHEALRDIAGISKEYAPEQKNIKVNINL